MVPILLFESEAVTLFRRESVASDATRHARGAPHGDKERAVKNTDRGAQARFTPQPSVPRIGLGAMRFSIEGRPRSSRFEAIVTAAVEHGIRLIDTADSYHLPLSEPPGHNEVLIATAIRRLGVEAYVDIATKGGHIRDSADRVGWSVCGRPDYLRAAALASLRRLKVETLFLYQLHRPDPKVFFEDSVGALADLLSDGLAQSVGISNVTFEQLRSAHAILGRDLRSVQNAHSIYRPLDPRIQAYCSHEGIQLFARSPLGGSEGARSLASIPEIVSLAKQYNITPQQLALAWVAQTAPRSIALVGVTRLRHWLDALASQEIVLPLTKTTIEERLRLSR
ncbi:aldo/keto reductase [Microbacterium sp. P04]|uniref:aldo/keto reductase n=1 Tax=Microbacterium sp. P04 TaxID=3366947 RepID=UPI0037472958